MLKIETDEDLLNFLKIEGLSYKVMSEAVSKYLKVLIVFEMSKAELIEATQKYIERFSNGGDTPIFLFSESNDITIKDAIKK